MIKKKQEILAKLVADAKYRASLSGIPFSLTAADLRLPNFCPALGIPIEKGVGRRTDASPSLDRIDQDRGYTRDNVVVVSWKVNRVKNNASTDELCQIADFYA